MTLPSLYRPKSRDEFIGPAAKEAATIERLIAACKQGDKAPIKLLILGEPGTGKSSLSDYFCQAVGASKWATHRFNGTSFRIDDVEDLARSVHYTNTFGDYRVIQIEEVDRCNPVVQVRILTLLDDLPPGNAILCTSNCSVKDLESRFQSRFQVIQLKAPAAEEIAAFLSGRWKLATSISNQIAQLACGNVRQVLLDAQSYLVA